MDVAKVKAVETAIAGAKAAIKALTDSELAARSFKGLQKLGDADAKLDQSLAKVKEAQERATPKEKPAKEEKPAAKK